MTPAGRIRHRDYDEVPDPGTDLLVAAGAYVGLVGLVRLDPVDLRRTAAHGVLDERFLAERRPASA